MNKICNGNLFITSILMSILVTTGAINTEAQRMPVDAFSFNGEEIYQYEFSPSGQKLLQFFQLFIRQSANAGNE